ncbi:uncharacterized protein LOC135462875 isoform X2 [Liolophura sinensis]|uniref:uncharacterized protein LOC135462875 isoform X2 n=1 Tax=Liolophura sinensis TaxID=3198878 RepID=UPI0031594FB2
MQQSSTFYCLGKGVTQCGARLCGYGAECNTDKSVCRCSSSNGALTKLNDTYPSLWYCLGEGVTQCGSQLCGIGTECNTTSGLCECSPRNRVLTQLTDTSPALSYCEGDLSGFRPPSLLWVCGGIPAT